MSKSIHVYNGSWLGLCLLSAILAGGCQEYGARDRKVTLESDPPGAKAYVVPNQVWLKWLEENDSASAASKAPNRVEMLRRAEQDGKLEKYDKGPTPVTVELPPYETVYVAKQNEQILYKVFTPKEFKNTVTVQFPGAAAPAVLPKQ